MMVEKISINQSVFKEATILDIIFAFAPEPEIGSVYPNCLVGSAFLLSKSTKICIPAVPKIVHPIFLFLSTNPLPIPAHTTSTGGFGPLVQWSATCGSRPPGGSPKKSGGSPDFPSAKKKLGGKKRGRGGEFGPKKNCKANTNTGETQDTLHDTKG